VFIVPHVLVGQAIGQRLEHGTPAALLAWASHYLLDRVPHVDIMPLLGAPLGTPVDSRGVLAAALDTAAATALGLRLARGEPARRAMLVGGVMAALPDVLDNVPLWGPRLHRCRPFLAQGYLHYRCNRPLGPTARRRGLLPQIAVATGALAMIWAVAGKRRRRSPPEPERPLPGTR
jgi:hypothetical protein